MPKVDLYTITGSKSGQIELPEAIFAAKINKPLMAQAVRVYLSNQRQSLAKVKTRGEVAKTTAKWYRQKGTGRARHGAKSAPIFIGGGVAHGPKAEQNYQLKMPAKMKKQALFSALTSKLKADQIRVIKDLDKLEGKTKEMKEVLTKLQQGEKKSKFLLVLPGKLEKVIKSARNIPGLFLIQADHLNTYEILNGGQIILMKESVATMRKQWS
ncbi:50S ribosomal protein L4 [Candidatus Shapirobacteria bacterium]|nr:50S ribosomal protein L4 [Candidatus Shapirobacteria bacterium]